MLNRKKLITISMINLNIINSKVIKEIQTKLLHFNKIKKANQQNKLKIKTKLLLLMQTLKN